MKSLFKTAHGKASILKLYEDKLKQLKLKTRTKDIQTSFGKTHIIITAILIILPLYSFMEQMVVLQLL